jgi:hypothetical protein
VLIVGLIGRTKFLLRQQSQRVYRLFPLLALSSPQTDFMRRELVKILTFTELNGRKATGTHKLTLKKSDVQYSSIGEVAEGARGFLLDQHLFICKL